MGLELDLLKNIYKWYEDNNPSRFSNRLGGSIIGEKCNRKLWYSFRWADKQSFDGRMLRLFQTGHLEEPRLCQDLINAGAELVGNQYEVTACDGHFVGKLDEVALIEGKYYLIEFKTHSEKSYSSVFNKGVKDSKPKHYAQCQVYMLLAGLDKAIYIAKNKNTDELYAEMIDLDKKYAQDLIKKANDIIKSCEPPERITDRVDSFECKFCQFHDICHVKKQPMVNCRTCVHSTPEKNAEWSCAINIDAIAKNPDQACENHLYIPKFFDKHSVAISADDNSVTYECKSTCAQWINKKGGVIEDVQAKGLSNKIN